MQLLISTTPIPAHTFNAAAFASACLARGDTVIWHAPARFHAPIRALGAKPVHVQRAWDPGDAGELPAMGSLAQVRRAYAQHVVGGARGRAEDLLALIDRHEPDLVLSDTLAYGAGPAADLAGLPWVTFGDGPLHDRDPDTPPFGSGLPYRTGPAFRLRNAVVQRATDLLFADSARSLAATRRALGLGPDPTDLLGAGVSPWLHLHGGVPALEYPRRRPAGGVHFVGSLYRRRPDVAPPSWCATVGRDDAPVIAVTQGSLRLDVDELIRPVVHALRDLDCTIVIATPSPQGLAWVRSLGRSRATVHAAAYVSYDALVGPAALLVTNGGWTGVTTALAHGVPVLQVGRTEEKADIGRRVEWSGCGLSIRARHPRPARLRQAVEHILANPRIAARTDQVRHEFAVRDAGTDGADLMHLLLAGSLPAPGDDARGHERPDIEPADEPTDQPADEPTDEPTGGRLPRAPLAARLPSS